MRTDEFVNSIVSILLSPYTPRRNGSRHHVHQAAGMPDSVDYGKFKAPSYYSKCNIVSRGLSEKSACTHTRLVLV